VSGFLVRPMIGGMQRKEPDRGGAVPTPPTSGRRALSLLPGSLRACEGCSLPRPKNDGGGLHRAEAQRGEGGRRERKEQVREGGYELIHLSLLARRNHFVRITSHL